MTWEGWRRLGLSAALAALAACPYAFTSLVALVNAGAGGASLPPWCEAAEQALRRPFGWWFRLAGLGWPARLPFVLAVPALSALAAFAFRRADDQSPDR